MERLKSSLTVKDFIILGLIAVVFFVLFFRDKEPIDHSGEILEMNEEINDLKEGQQEIRENLNKKYEIIDTASKPVLHDLTSDLLRRTNTNR